MEKEDGSLRIVTAVSTYKLYKNLKRPNKKEFSF